MTKADHRDHWSEEEALSLVKTVESLFNPWNVDAIVDGFSPDCIVRFCNMPEFSGHEKLRAFFLARSKRQKNYRLQKTFKSVAANVICNTWRGTWHDTSTGKDMEGFGCEVWTMAAGKIAIWEAAFNANPVGEASSLVI